MEELCIGQVMATVGIRQEMEETYGFREFCMDCLMRHRDHDWGDLEEEDWLSNDEAVKSGERVLSAYDIPKKFCLAYADRIWIITEADRNYTTILFPYEY